MARLLASIVVVVVVAGEVRSFHAKQAEDDVCRSSVDNTQTQTRLYLELPAPRVVADGVLIYTRGPCCRPSLVHARNSNILLANYSVKQSQFTKPTS